MILNVVQLFARAAGTEFDPENLLKTAVAAGLRRKARQRQMFLMMLMIWMKQILTMKTLMLLPAKMMMMTMI